jgi:hypothetical protein
MPNVPGAQFQHSGQIQDAINRGLGTNRVAPQASMDSPYAPMQYQQAQQLQRIASGQQQGAGELAAQRQEQNALAGQQAMARMNRGSGAGMGMLGAARNSAGIGLAGAGMGQQAAFQDQQAAQSQLTNAMGQARGQDQQVQLANLDAQLRQMGMDDQQRLGYLQQLTGMDQAQLNAQMQAYQAQMGQYQSQQQQKGAMLGQAGQMMGGMMAMSDERNKKDIAPAGELVDDLLDQLKPYSYSYKDERWGKGARAGIMAQDMERSELGRRIVQDTSDGKQLDVNKALSGALASLARLNERLRKVEAR